MTRDLLTDPRLDTLHQVIACPAFPPLLVLASIVVAVLILAALGVGDTRAKPRRRGR